MQKFLSFMSKFTLSLGTWFDTPVFLHWSWLLMALYVGWSDPYMAVVYASIFFIVILHEFGHVLMSKWYGHSASSITIYPIGGVALLNGIPATAVGELLVALAGPLVNFLLAIPLYFWWGLSNYMDMVIATNFALLIFNLIPAFPMDGGRVFRAVLWPMVGYYRATMIAVYTSRVFAAVFIGLSIYFRHPTLWLIGLFLIITGNQEKRRVALNNAIKGVHELLVPNSDVHLPAMNAQRSAEMVAEIEVRITQALARLDGRS